VPIGCLSLLQAFDPAAACQSDAFEILDQTVAHHLENARVLVGPLADPIYQRIQIAMQLLVEETASVVRRHRILVNQIDDLPGGVLCPAGESWIGDRHLEQRALQAPQQ